jgi:hypothetical protein
VGEPRLEIDLADLGGDVNEKARRIDLDGDTLKITVVPFTFTLAARSESLQRHLVTLTSPPLCLASGSFSLGLLKSQVSEQR